MIESMTGFGHLFFEYKNIKITIEIKSLNSKYFDLNLRIPDSYKALVMELRRKISHHLLRGKIDCLILIEENKDFCYKLNEKAINGYMSQLEAIVPNLNKKNYLEMALKIPETFTHSNEDSIIIPEEYLFEQIEKALEELKRNRKKEGKTLEDEMVIRINTILDLLKKVDSFEQERKKIIQENLNTSFKNNNLIADPNRFEQELIYYYEKININEEKVRLKAHCDYFLDVLKENHSQGKKLGFIIQEIGREVNTLGAKSFYAAMQKCVILMKEELDKIREQLFNVL